MGQLLFVSKLDEYALLATVAASLHFLLDYTYRADWWRYKIGQALFIAEVWIILALAPSAIHYITGLNIQRLWFGYYYGASLGLVALWTEYRIYVNRSIHTPVTPGTRLRELWRQITRRRRPAKENHDNPFQGPGDD